MDNQKYLVIITLIDGQNFTVPEGAPDKIEASVFAEARFGAESVLRSDPITLTNSNPEFVTELAWQLDRRSLHQLRVERKAIKLQVFLQTKERKKSSRQNNEQSNTNGWSNDSGDTHKVELIGYTILDLRSAQLKERPKFQWLPLLNPKFRKPSYNRPEIQLAITLSRLDDEAKELPSLIDSSRREVNEDTDRSNEKSSETNGGDSSNDTRFFTTCLETTSDLNQIHSDEIIDNDIIIRYMNDVHHIYDANHPQKCKLEDCKEPYEILISIPFGCGLDSLVIDNHDKYYVEIRLFGVAYKTTPFDDLTFTSQPAEIRVQLQTTHSGALATYFELNPNLDINLHSDSGKKLGVAAVQLNQLCSLDMKCRSIEGIFVMQPVNDHDQEQGDEERASIGVSIILEKRPGDNESNPTRPCDDLNMAKEHFGEDIDEFMFKSIMHDTHQLTAEPSTNGICNETERSSNNLPASGLIMEDHDDGPGLDDHHYCFTIDLKKFTYSYNQKLIPTLRELVIRYSYPFFGYKDTITTDASIPINATSSIIVSGFCEFNFATTPEPLLTALRELPLDLEILAFDDSRLKDYDQSANEKVACCNINLAEILKLNETNIKLLEDNPASETTLAPIYASSGDEMGHLQVYLCLKDLGRPSQRFKASIESLNESQMNLLNSTMTKRDSIPSNELRKVDTFIADMKRNFETWKEEFSIKLSDDVHKTNSDRLRRLYQRVEAKEAKRDLEIRKKIDELEYLEKKFKSSLSSVENLEKMLTDSIEQMRVKNSVLDAKLEMVDVKISQLLSYNNRLESKQQLQQQPSKTMQTMQQQRSFDDHLITNRNTAKPVPPKNVTEKDSPRRASLKTQTGPPSIPLPVRSSSLVRGPAEGTTTATRIVKRASGVSATVINGINSRVRSNSARLNLSKDTQEKLANLRKEKAELLKRGCKPTDELIQEINSLIEKLAC